MKNKKKFFNRIFNDVKLNKNLPSIDFHIHTNWTDGKNSVKQVYKRSNSVGLDYMLYSEHSRKSSKGWFKRFHREIKSLQIKNCKPFVGTEVKVLNLNGDLGNFRAGCLGLNDSPTNTTTYKFTAEL